MENVSSTFPEVTTPNIQMSCMRAFQGAIAHASIRLSCGICEACSKRIMLFIFLSKMRICDTIYKLLKQVQTLARSPTADYPFV